MSLNHFYTGPTCRISYRGPLIVMCLEGATELADLEQLGKCQDLIAPHHAKISSITVMNSGFMTVRPGTVEKAAELSAKYKGQTGCSILLVNGRGLMAVMARAGIAAYSMTDRSGTRIKTFNVLIEALAALKDGMAELGTPLTDAEVDEVKNFIEARPLRPAAP